MTCWGFIVDLDKGVQYLCDHAPVCGPVLPEDEAGAEETQLCHSYQLPGAGVWIQKVTNYHPHCQLKVFLRLLSICQSSPCLPGLLSPTLWCSISFTFCLCLSLCISLSVCLSVSFCLCLSLSVSVCLTVFLSFFLYVSLCLFLSLSVSLSLSFSACLCVCLSLSLSLSVSFSVCLCIFL